MNCKELFLNDIVAFKVYKASECTIPVPFNVPNISALTLSALTLPTPLLSVAMTDTDITLDSPASLSVTHERVASGLVYTHTLEATIYDGGETLASAIQAIGTDDFILITTNAEGTSFLHYPCPVASSVDNTLSDSDSTESNSFKLTIKSLSSRITLQ